MTEDQRNLPDDRAPASGTAAEAIIQRFGGIRPMANKLGVTASTVQGWKARGQIPEARHELVLAAARSNKIPLEPSELVAAEAPPAEAGKSAPADASPSPQPASTPAGGSAPSAASRPTAPQPEPSAPSSASAESKEAPPRRPAGPPPPDSPDAAGSGGSSMVAKLALGVATLALLAAIFMPLWMPADEAAQENGQEEIIARIAALEEAPEPQAVDLTPLEERLAAVEEAVAVEPVDLSPLEARLGELEQSGEGLVDLGEAVGRLNEQQQALERELSAIPSVDLAPLEQRLAALENALAELPDPSETIAALDARLQDVETRLASPDAEAFGRAVWELTQAVESGQPYVEPLEALAALDAGGQQATVAIQQLAPYAENGVESWTALARRFSEAAAEARAADRQPGPEAGFMDRALGALDGLITVRPAAGEAEGEEAAAVLARAEARLQDDRWEDALTELEALEGPAAAAMAPWRRAVRARLIADRALARLAQPGLAELDSP